MWSPIYALTLLVSKIQGLQISVNSKFNLTRKLKVKFNGTEGIPIISH